eukprot:gb/GFBE01077740.1/.p1 GENE.gb/GFBE01077740.1/~~gb/GFBE01077740.1/.p1  ORF type:complete len:599 (+),score=116.66 gb/GFBE01077740.1/:1-1797(+)
MDEEVQAPAAAVLGRDQFLTCERACERAASAPPEIGLDQIRPELSMQVQRAKTSTTTSRVSIISACSIEEDVLRAVRARECLWQFGKLMRSNAGSRDTFKLSMPVKKIKNFWSHSWHAPQTRKIMTLFYFYNCSVAFCGAVAVAFLAATFVRLGYLPGQACVSAGCSSHSDCGVGEYCSLSSKTGARCVLEAFCCSGIGGMQSIDGDCPISCDAGPVPLAYDAPFHLWPLMFGVMTFTLIFFLWQPSDQVFLDKVCIHQTDMSLKQKGIDCLGGFLRNSNAMTILWDQTYFTRLWCVFELAAFLHVKAGSANMVVQPITHGHVIVAVIFLNLARAVISQLTFLVSPTIGYALDHVILGVVGVWFMHLSRSYARDYLQMKQQIESFVPQEADCYCCKVNHRMPGTGAVIPCDRQCIYESIDMWFEGGLEEFQEAVRTKMHSQMQRRIGSMYRYRDALKIGLSTILIYLSEARLFCMDWTSAQHFFSIFLYEWLAVTPFLLAFGMLLAILARREHEQWQCDIAISVCLTVPWAAAAFGLEQLRAQDPLRTLAIGVALVLVANLALSGQFFGWLCKVVLPSAKAPATEEVVAPAIEEVVAI